VQYVGALFAHHLLSSFCHQPGEDGDMCNLEIIRQVQLVSKFKAGHVVMIDKQFSLEGKLLENCIRLIIPPFVRKGKQFLEEKKRTNKFRRTIPQKRVMGRVRELQHPGFECTRDSV